MTNRNTSVQEIHRQIREIMLSNRDEIKDRLESGMTQAEAAEYYGINLSTFVNHLNDIGIVAYREFAGIPTLSTYAFTKNALKVKPRKLYRTSMRQTRSYLIVPTEYISREVLNSLRRAVDLGPKAKTYTKGVEDEAE